MNTVEPIRDLDMVRNIKNYLREKNERDYLLFLLGIYTGLRISDILKLKVRDVKGKKALNIRDKKTGKENKLDFNRDLLRAISSYTEDKSPDDVLFESKKGTNKAITRTQAYRILNEAAEVFNIGSIGTHSLRKTFGYHLYQSTNKDIAIVQNALNHSNSEYTLRYIGVKQETLNKAIHKLNF